MMMNTYDQAKNFTDIWFKDTLRTIKKLWDMAPVTERNHYLYSGSFFGCSVYVNVLYCFCNHGLNYNWMGMC